MNDGESSEYDDSSDVDYVPPKDDEEYYVYCGEEDANVMGDDNGAETAMVEDNETMFGVIDSDDEIIRHETNSDDETNIMKFPEFNANTDMKDPQFCVGMILGLDGCHLKIPYGGQLLSAVGLDANNTSWVVAYSMVEQEFKDSWIWFLELLAKDVNITDEGVGWTFISDKQKGLLQAFEMVVPYADLRFCVRHLLANFHKIFSAKKLNDQIWAIAKSTTWAYFEKEMMVMKQLEPSVVDWLTDPSRSAKYWSKAYFNTTPKCDILLNNLCESFNAFILPARTKPIITIFEDIRVRLMKRVHTKKNMMMKNQDHICPKPREVLEINKVKATDCFPIGSGSAEIEVESKNGSKYVVDLQRRMCACRRWELTSIPCQHVVAAIYYMRLKPEDIVDACYTKKTYMDIYSNTIRLVNVMDLWVRTGNDTILPPKYNRQPGRPKNKRIKYVFEKATDGTIKLGRIQKSLGCSNCGESGHNVKTCHRHLPPKKNINKKSKSHTESGTPSIPQAKGTKKYPLRKDEKIARIQKRAEQLKEKRDLKRARKINVEPSTTTARSSNWN